MKTIFLLLLFVGLTSCWPSKIGFKDTGGMPEEWKNFHLQTLQNNAATCPISYPASLTESIKDGIQNNTRLGLATSLSDAQVQLSGEITSYAVNPIAIQNGDNAAKNRLTVSIQFTIITTVPKAEEFKLSVTRFADFDASTNLSSVESQLLTTINEQVIQDVINKLMSNW
jgi:outer membrane lipopolysaccharide assembly protein LptE/RlpB